MMKERQGINFQSLLVDSISIVFAVLLALAVDQWRESNSEQKQAAIALQNIRNELEANRKILELIHGNNAATVAAMSATDESTQEQQFIPGGQLQATAWQTFLSTGVSNHVDYDTVLKLSATYSIQAVYKETGNQITSAAMNVAAYATVVGKEVQDEDFERQFRGYFEIMISIEATLLESYESTLVHFAKDQ